MKDTSVVSSPVLRCKDLRLGYDGKEIVHGLDFEVHEGDYLCIVGENGSGKSTLVKTIVGLLSPLSGEISFCGGLSSKDIGYLPQQTLAQRDFPASVREIVLSGAQGKCGHRPFYGKAEKKLAEDCMKRLGIADIASKCYRELSGGQQQRTLLARALCATGKLLVLDEPVSGLDPTAMASMYELIDGLNKNDKITVIMISHDIPASMKYATHVLHVGPKPFFGTREEYEHSEQRHAFCCHEGGAH
ncbi:MAG: ABC transporter ATP-binding protein [Ruminococcaceae bacterium]|nr:ABC transporter ATP-binding protein [Oscillospiraceae bacterium]